MKIEIKSSFGGSVLCAHECDGNSIKITLEAAVKARADLRGANLEGANLEGANLGRADLRGANLRRANLRRADLRGANLRRADLEGADLRGANLRGATYGAATLANGLLQLLGLAWSVLIFDAHIQIGCELHTTAEWSAFDDATIAKMANGATEFWAQHKPTILALAKAHQERESNATKP